MLEMFTCERAAGRYDFSTSFSQLSVSQAEYLSSMEYPKLSQPARPCRWEELLFINDAALKERHKGLSWDAPPWYAELNCPLSARESGYRQSRHNYLRGGGVLFSPHVVLPATEILVCHGKLTSSSCRDDLLTTSCFGRSQ